MFTIAGVISIILFLTLALRLIYIYPLLPVSFVVYLFADLFLSISPMAMVFVILFVKAQINQIIEKRNQKKQHSRIRGLEA